MIRARGVVALGLVVALWAVLIVSAASAGATERQLQPRYRHAPCALFVFRAVAGVEPSPGVCRRLAHGWPADSRDERRSR